MSTHFDLYCETCEAFGPEIRRSSTTSFAIRTRQGFLLGQSAQEVWTAFLIEHEFHDLRLRREGTRQSDEDR